MGNIIKLYNKNNSIETLQTIADTLNDGGIIIYPTDTMYAMGCHALKERPIERICKLKKIDPRKHHLSIICYDLSNISEYAKVSNTTFKLMKRNLPGPFTFILKADSRLPKIFRNRKEVGIRVPDNDIIRDICRMIQILMTRYPHLMRRAVQSGMTFWRCGICIQIWMMSRIGGVTDELYQSRAAQ